MLCEWRFQIAWLTSNEPPTALLSQSNLSFWTNHNSHFGLRNGRTAPTFDRFERAGALQEVGRTREWVAVRLKSLTLVNLMDVRQRATCIQCLDQIFLDIAQKLGRKIWQNLAHIHKHSFDLKGLEVFI